MGVSKTLAGACFAGMLVMSPLLLLKAYAASDMPVVFNALQPAMGLGFSFGPVTGYYTYLLSTQSGWSQQHAYNPFFYACAALSVIAGLNMALLHFRLSHCGA